MNRISVRELRNHGGEALDRVARGAGLIVTRDGVDAAELRPLPRARLSAAVLIERRRRLPRVDPADLRADLDDLLDPGLDSWV